MSLMMENQEFQDLDRRLSVHLQKVQQMRQTPDNITSTGFLDAIKILEEELFNMKQLYEKELIQCRRMADDRSREKAHFAIQVEKLTGELSDMEERYKLETEHSQKLHDQLNTANVIISEKEAMIRETNAMLNGPVGDLERLRREQDSITKESETIKSRYETESQLRHEAEDKIHQLEQKLEFDAKLQREEVHDLNDRLQTAANTIMALEAKIREITDSDKTLSEMLRQVHDAADAEIRRYQEESVQEYNRHIRALKCQIDEDTRKMDSMNLANENLLAQIEELTKRIRALEGQIASLEHQKGSIEDILRDERATSRAHIQNLEDKLRDLQDTLFIKMREINASRDAQVSMKAEIEGFRTLLEDEERRLRLTAPVSTSLSLGSTMPGTTAGVYSTNAGATTGPVFLPPPAEPVESPKTSSQLLGPIRARSAPASSIKARTTLVSSSLGQGKDYFDDMFRDLKRTTVTGIPKLPSPPPQNAEVVPPSSPQQAFMPKQVEIQPTSVKTHDYNTYSSSATGDLRILEVHPEGKYVRLVNTANKDYDIGGYLLEQMVGGHPVVVYRFPPRTRFDGNGTVTIWSSTADHKMHDPPSNFVWKEQQKWGTGPECTTILCKPNGQAIAWTTAAHRFFRDMYDSNSSPDSAFHDGTMQNGGQEELTELETNINAAKPELVFLRREKTSPPSLAAQKHPFGNAPSSPPHTHTGQVRVQTYGNDNSSVNRQSRSQGSRPDPIPGAPYAGASAQRMGSAMLRRYNITGSGSVANKAGGNMRYGMPSPFTSPLQQDFARSHDTRATALVRY